VRTNYRFISAFAAEQSKIPRTMREILLLLCSLWCTVACSQNVGTHDFYEPHPLRPGENIMNLGLSVTLLPEPIVVQEVPAPALTLLWKHGITDWFSGYATLSSNYVTNFLSVGAQINVGDDDFSFALGDAMGVFAGVFDLGGEFEKNSAAAIANTPTLRIGHRFKDVALSASFSASYLLHAGTTVASIEDRHIVSKFNDVTLTLALEQSFARQMRVSTGMSVTFSRTPYQIWMLYNTFDQYLMMPEFFFSIRL
jgi:hypothetical protein